MANAYLAYWKQGQFQEAYREPTLQSVGSDQFRRRGIPVGSRLWIVNAPTTHTLATIGYLDVARFLSRSQASKELGGKVFNAAWHAFGKPGAGVRPKIVDLTPVAKRLRFAGTDRDRLALGGDAEPLGAQLRQMRLLTPDSAALLRKVFGDGEDQWAEEIQDELEEGAIEAGDVPVKGKARKEQGRIRRRLLAGSTHGRCIVCGALLPAGLLIAAHVKPRSLCTKKEREDWRRNVFLMCDLGCDGLFERGLLVGRLGRFRLVGEASTAKAFASIRKRVNGRRLSPEATAGALYFDWHADNAPARRRKVLGG